jgi:hypothetical protein
VGHGWFVGYPLHWLYLLPLQDGCSASHKEKIERAISGRGLQREASALSQITNHTQCCINRLTFMTMSYIFFPVSYTTSPWPVGDQPDFIGWRAFCMGISYGICIFFIYLDDGRQG